MLTYSRAKVWILAATFAALFAVYDWWFYAAWERMRAYQRDVTAAAERTAEQIR